MRTETQRVLYLLHFDVPLGTKHHYLGITKRDQFERRMRDHATGRGSPITRELAKINSDFYCARLWPDATYAEERRRKKSANLKRSCPICAKGQMDLEMRRFNTSALLNTPLRSRGLSFTKSGSRTQKQKPMKKGVR